MTITAKPTKRQPTKTYGQSKKAAGRRIFAVPPLFSEFKAELVEGGVFETVKQAGSGTFSYIEEYYNWVRLYSGLGDKSSLEFAQELKIKQLSKRDFFGVVPISELLKIFKGGIKVDINYRRINERINRKN